MTGLARIAAGAGNWFRARFHLEPVLDFMAAKSVPIHRRSGIYLLGGAAAFLFGLQVLSGCLLLLYYQPTVAAAHESVGRIMRQVPYGWLVRSAHVWIAHLFIGVTALHFITVLFTRAYRKPRELTWVVGMVLLFLALGFGFSGYVLPWNERAYYATLVGTRIPAAVPGLGDLAVRVLRGGDQVTGDTLTRLFAAHVVFLPGVFLALLLLHLVLVQIQGISLPPGVRDLEVKDHRPFFSEFLLIDASVWLWLFGTVMTLAVVFPAELGVKADPLRPAPEGVRPEWYFLFLFKTLKLVPETVGVIFFALGAAFFVALPFLDRRASRGEKSPGFTLVFLGCLVYAGVFELLAWLEPQGREAPERLEAKTYGLAGSVVSLTLLWALIAFLLVYVRLLLRENTRVRALYRESGSGDESRIAPST
jgi:cytochrome b6